MELARAIVASFWPQKLRRWWYPAEPATLVRGTAISGFLEFVIFGCLEFRQFTHHLQAQAAHFANANEGTTVAALVVIAVAELFYPVSFLLMFFAFEGLIRFVAGAIVHEAVPTLALVLLVRSPRKHL